MTVPSDAPSGFRLEVASAERVVLKVGTRVLTHAGGRLALSRLFRVVEVAADLVRAGRAVLLVSSGAVGLGKDALGLEVVPDDLDERQACAAVGQSRLMQLYQEGFNRLGLTCGQILVTEDDFDDRVRYLNLRRTLNTLLRYRVVPVINENDVVSVQELVLVQEGRRSVFGDNDRLSALVATKLDADLLVLLTDVDGVFDQDPRRHPEAELVRRIDTPDVEVEVGGSGSDLGRGGMKSKVEAASIAARSGCHAVIASGVEPGALEALLAGGEVGTWFPARSGMRAKKRWIAYAAKPRGTLVLDGGAVEALRGRGASLLAAGVVSVAGEFARGDVVELLDESGQAIGRGMVFCDADTARRWSGRQGGRERGLLVRRELLVLTEAKEPG